VEGATSVRIFGEPVAVRAQIHTLGGFSAHADRDEILDWVSHFRTPGIRIFVVHGEEKSALALAAGLREKGFSRVEVPHHLESVDLGKALGPRSEVKPAASMSLPEKLEALERKARRLRKKLSKAELSEQTASAMDQKAQELAELLDQLESMAALSGKAAEPLS